MDPHAENYLPVSPYAYVGNSPILFIDPDGRDKFKFFGSFSLTTGKVGARARVGDMGIGGSYVPFGGSEMTLEGSTTIDNSNGEVVLGGKAEHADVSEGSGTGTFGLLSGSATEKDITAFTWDSVEGSDEIRQNEKESTSGIFILGEKTTEIEVKDTSGNTTETKTEDMNTLNLSASYEINLLIIGFEINIGVYAEEPK